MRSTKASSCLPFPQMKTSRRANDEASKTWESLICQSNCKRCAPALTAPKQLQSERKCEPAARALSNKGLIAGPCKSRLGGEQFIALLANARLTAPEIRSRVDV